MRQIYNLDEHHLASAPFETQTRLTDIAMAVSPYGLIGDMVCPAVRTPFKFTYMKHETADRMSIPEMRASRASELNEVEFGADDVNDQTKDWGLLTPVPDRDVREAEAQSAPIDPIANATAVLATLLKLAREKRVADLVFTAASYEDGYSVTLAGTSQWSSNTSDPKNAILQAMDKPLVRPNCLVFGQQTWTEFRQHPKIVEAIKMSGAGEEAEGAVQMKAVAELFEVEHVLVGRAKRQTSNRGQDPAYGYIWGKHAALLHVNRNLMGPPDEVQPSFCFRAEAMEMQSGTYLEGGRGVGQGSTMVKVSESVKELVSWNDAGFLWRNAVA